MPRLFVVLSVLVSSLAFAGPVKVTILSAVVKDQHIEGAEVTLQKNGAASVAKQSGTDGSADVGASFSDTDDGVLLIVKKPGYSTLVARCPCNGMTYAISPVMKSLDGLRVVLNWGAMPPDLDSHMMSPGSHVSYHSKIGLDTKLDVDDTDGFGPETVTVEKKHFGEKYVYAVHSYTDKDDPTSSRLSQSRATVYVYVGQSLIKRYAVPDQGAGNVWMVFSLDGAGEFHDLNQLLQTSGTPDAALRQALGGAAAEVPATGAVSSASASSPGPAQVEVRPAPVTDADVLARAHEINARGEKAYHAGQLDQSIELYLQAIELDGGYGQAYSNLGLSYQKANRVAEALWANRKSIALAHGEGANVVRASSYYNIAKIYETAGQWADAAQQFQLANTERPLKAYADGAARNAAKAAH